MLVGLDKLRRSRGSHLRQRLEGAAIGVLTHSAAVDSRGCQTLDVLAELELDVRVVFTPEHGLDGLEEAERPVESEPASIGAARVVSLYGKDRASLTPTAADLEGLDVLLIDLVDIGSRYYTYVWSALLCARAAADRGIHSVVLDRDNPISGNVARLEGRAQEAGFCSFVGLEPLPIRHSMTLGEILALLFNQEDRSLGPDGQLSIVPTDGWERHRLASSQGRAFVPPSPNMPSVETALLYPGGCLLEGTNLSEGRGTTRPFHLIGAPFLDGVSLAREVGDLPGAFLRPTRFRPSFDKHAGEICHGVSLHVTDEQRFRPVATYLRLLAAARLTAPDDFRLLDRVYEFESEHRAFDLLTGSEQAGSLLEAGASAEELIEAVCPVDPEWEIQVETAEELVIEIKA